MGEEAIRIDKWLWAVRLFKTRSQASQACSAHQVRIEGRPVKPSSPVRVGDLVEVRLQDITRTVKAVGLAEKRIGAKLVPELLEDLTPESEYERQKEFRKSSPAQRLRGSGRPTKKERRQIDHYFEL